MFYRARDRLILGFVLVTVFSVSVLGSPFAGAKLRSNYATRRAQPFSIDEFDQSQSPSTARIAREVRHELLLLPYYNVFDWISFQVQPDHTVILRGSVVTPPDTKSAAEAAARQVDGVERVVNEIEVLPVSPMDDRLRQALYRAVYSGPLFRYAFGSLNQIHIVVKNGNATLEGQVDSTADRQLAYMQAMTVPGVFSVTNNLQTNEMPR